MIVFDDVCKTFADGTTAVHGLSLVVPNGKLTVFVGSSGSGKTTALRMINRMIEPTSGSITVDGEDIAGVNPVQLRLGMGYVIQHAGLMPHQRVIDNVATVPVLRGSPAGRPARRPTRCWNASGWTPNLPTDTRRSSPAENNSASAWHAHWPPIRQSC